MFYDWVRVLEKWLQQIIQSVWQMKTSSNNSKRKTLARAPAQSSHICYVEALNGIASHCVFLFGKEKVMYMYTVFDIEWK